MTNFEKIKAMTAEEFVSTCMSCPNKVSDIDAEAWCKVHCGDYDNCADCCLAYLRTEYPDE